MNPDEGIPWQINPLEDNAFTRIGGKEFEVDLFPRVQCDTLGLHGSSDGGLIAADGGHPPWPSAGPLFGQAIFTLFIQEFTVKFSDDG